MYIHLAYYSVIYAKYSRFAIQFSTPVILLFRHLIYNMDATK